MVTSEHTITSTTFRHAHGELLDDHAEAVVLRDVRELHGRGWGRDRGGEAGMAAERRGGPHVELRRPLRARLDSDRHRGGRCESDSYGKDVDYYP